MPGVETISGHNATGPRTECGIDLHTEHALYGVSAIDDHFPSSLAVLRAYDIVRTMAGSYSNRSLMAVATTVANRTQPFSRPSTVGFSLEVAGAGVLG